MAQKVVYLDDIDGTEGARTIPFALDGTLYEIDLAEDNEKRLLDSLSPFLDGARTIRAGHASQRKTTHPSHTPQGRDRNTQIRAWAKTKGYTISSRGRVPTKVIAEYDAAGI